MPTKPTSATELITRSGRHSLTLRVASHFFSRLRGLMFAAPLRPNHGLLITRCASVHTGFMRAAIDVVYLDQYGSVTECIANLRPWRGSRSGGRHADGIRRPRARHTLELRAGSIARLHIQPGDWLQHPVFEPRDRAAQSDSALTLVLASASSLTPAPSSAPLTPTSHQRGSAMIEFAVVGPIITLIGLATIQYGLLFFQKNQLNHASFMAARAGSTGHANIDTIQRAYAQALVPIYGGGTSTAALAASFERAFTDVQTHSEVKILNPTAESYTDFNDSTLQSTEGKGKRVIPNSHQATRSAADIRANSGQNIQDANLLKLRITMGYAPQVPIMGKLYSKVLSWMDDGTNAFNTALLQEGRIPVVTHVVVQMQSDAIEGPTVSSPGMGNGGNPTDPGDPPVTTKPPPCASGDTLCQSIPPETNPETPPAGPNPEPTCL